MQNSQDAINPHLLLHTKAGPESPDSHNYYRIGPPQQQHILGEASYLHYTPQPPPPSLTPPSRSSHGRGAGRASIEARYRALMRNMLMYQQMRIRATSTPYIEPRGPQQQQEEATLFSSFSLPPHHHHHHHLEYSLPSSFDLPPPAEPTMLDAAVSQAELVAAPTSSPPLQDPYQHHHYHQQQTRGSDPFECTNTYNDEEEAVTVPAGPGQSPKPSRISRGDPGGGGGSGRRRKPAHGGKPSDGSAASGSRTSSSRISRSKPRTRSKPRPRPRPIASAVQFALEELTTSTSSSSSSRFVQQQHYHHDDHSAEPLGGEAVRRNQGDGDGNQIDQDADDDDHGMRLDHVEDIHARATRDLVLECFVSSMTDGLG
ncbi:hypothetical protein F4775DRAFT_573808 [Biscogniauxia sp. FL1348]|nr:hypothetical protein F4775DRAFT_573808 [Biscogniauxia sp. FL1348]